MTGRSFARIAVAMLALALFAVPSAANAKPKKGNKGKTLVVCKHGCKYRTIQSAVDKARKTKTKKDVIKVKPGKYVEGVQVEGKKLNNLTIAGAKKNARKVVLEGKNAKTPGGSVANHGIEGADVKGLVLKNMLARNYQANGFFLNNCSDYLMKNLLAAYNRSYGLYAFNCKGGRITKSEGWGHGDSAFYIGQTPFQKKPKWTRLDHLSGYENVLGYSGTNSRYVKIEDSAFYNNGIGLVPNTLDSEKFEPTGDGIIQNNDIFWNNFNYFLPNSGVETVSGGLGTIDLGGGPKTLQYPTGIGVALFGADGWKVRNNDIFGNFKYGVATFSDPFNDGDDATSQNNKITNNTMGKKGADTNAVDFWADGSGSGNCWQGNKSSTFDPSDEAPNNLLYPKCPAPADSGTGTSVGYGDQVGELLNYVTQDPPENQECLWTQHAHPKFKKYKPVDVKPGPDCS